MNKPDWQRTKAEAKKKLPFFVFYLDVTAYFMV
jgi:transposase